MTAQTESSSAAELPAALNAGPDDFAVTSTGLTKQFRGGQIAVNNIDLAVPAGAIYGFLGPNGSGKTTTIRMLLGLVRPSSGTHTLLGGSIPQDSQRVLPRVGALVEGPAFGAAGSSAALDDSARAVMDDGVTARLLRRVPREPPRRRAPGRHR